MGASAGGVSVKTDISKYDLQKIVKDLIGTDFVKTENYEDTRHPDKYYLVKTNDVITIYNSQFVESFYKRQDTEDIQYFIDYFQKPELIFAHERYDSGGTYSYALIYNGELKRQFRSLSYETEINFGDLEEVEIDWKNGEVSKFDLGDGDFETIIRNTKTGFDCDETDLPQVILNHLQFDKLGFEDGDAKIIEKGFFIKAPKTTETASNTQNDTFQRENFAITQETKPWWKFW